MLTKAILNVQCNYGKSLEPCSERVASSNNKHVHIHRNVMKTIGLPFHMETNPNAKSKGWIYFQKDLWAFVQVHTESSISSNNNYSVKVQSTCHFQKGLSSFRTKVDSLSSVTSEWLICTGLKDHHTGTTVLPIFYNLSPNITIKKLLTENVTEKTTRLWITVHSISVRGTWDQINLSSQIAMHLQSIIFDGVIGGNPREENNNYTKPELSHHQEAWIFSKATPWISGWRNPT
jgi:hypothetical protein